MKYKKETKPKQGSSSEENPSSPTLSSCSNQSGSPNSSMGRAKNVSKIINEQQSIVERLMAHSPSSSYQNVTYTAPVSHNNINPYPTSRNTYKPNPYPNYLPQYNNQVSNVQYCNEQMRPVQDLSEANYIAQGNEMYQRYQTNYQMYPSTIDNQYETRVIEDDRVNLQTLPTLPNLTNLPNLSNYGNCMYEKTNIANEEEKVDYNFNPTVNVSWMTQSFAGNSVSPTLTQL